MSGAKAAKVSRVLYLLVISRSPINSVALADGDIVADILVLFEGVAVWTNSVARASQASFSFTSSDMFSSSRSWWLLT